MPLLESDTFTRQIYGNFLIIRVENFIRRQIQLKVQNVCKPQYFDQEFD